MNELALFSGAGGGILAGSLLGWHTACAVETNTFAASVLLARQQNGYLPTFPIWDDVRTFRGTPWHGFIDVVSGGFPCQDISRLGTQQGLDGKHSSLWGEMRRIIDEVRPRFVFMENSPDLLYSRGGVSGGFGRILGDLAALRYDARWDVLGASVAGAPHRRERLWLVAYSHGGRYSQFVEKRAQPEISKTGSVSAFGKWWQAEPGMVREVHGLAGGLDGLGTVAGGTLARVAEGVPNRTLRIKCLGNGQVPACAVMAWKTLTQGIL